MTTNVECITLIILINIQLKLKNTLLKSSLCYSDAYTLANYTI